MYQTNGLSFLGSLLRLFVFFLLVSTVLSDSLDQKNEKIVSEETHPARDLLLFATRAVIDGNVDMLKGLHEIDSELLRRVTDNDVTLATQAVLVEQLDILKWLYALDPELLRQIDKNGETPATTAAVNRLVNVLKFLYELDPKLLSQVAGGGFTPATRAAERGALNALKTLHELDSTLLRQEDGAGCTPAIVAAGEGKIGVLKLLHKLDPALLDQIDGNGWTPATAAAYLEKMDVLKTLFELDPLLLLREDGNGFTPATKAVEKGRIDVLKTLFKLHPALVGFKVWVQFNLEENLNVIVATIALGSTGFCIYAFMRLMENRGRAAPTPTIINVHNGSRDNKALDALAKLQAHVGTLSEDYGEVVLVKDLNLKRLRSGDVDTLTNYYNKNRPALFYMKYNDEGKVKSLECVLDKIERTENGIQVQFYIVPEIGHPLKTDLELLTINPDKSVTYNAKSYPENVVGIYYTVQSSEQSLISKAFQEDKTFRFALGFNTEYSDQLHTPLLFSSSQWLTPSGAVTSKGVIKLAHRFCKMEDDPSEEMLREASFIGGIKNGLQSRAQNEEQLYRFCLDGQLQYLLTAVIQGRLPGVMIDDVSMAGLKAIIPSKEDLINECCLAARHNKRDANQADFEAFVKEYMEKSAFLSGDGYPQLKEEFQRGIKVVAEYLD